MKFVTAANELVTTTLLIPAACAANQPPLWPTRPHADPPARTLAALRTESVPSTAGRIKSFIGSSTDS